MNTFKEFKALTLEQQKQWVNDHPEQFGEICYNECDAQSKKGRGVMPPNVCFYCKGCPIKTIVVGITKNR